MERSTVSQGESSLDPRWAVGLAAGAVLLMIVFGVTNVDGAVWLIVGVLGAAAAIVGWLATGGRPRGLTLAASIVGALLAVVVVVWGIVGG